jgi:predicted DNA-binding transcriptional regulator AlpA
MNSSNKCSAPLMATNAGVSPAPAEKPVLVTAAQLARMLQISMRSLYRLRSGNQLPPPLRVGGFTRWRRTDIENWVAAGCPVSFQLSSTNSERSG